jgi:thymidylate synthase ThyX
MKTRAKVIAHSANPVGCELFTFELCFPRFILPQVRTYGMLAYSVRSSRAVPTAKLIAEVEANPVRPREWRARQKGMVAGDALPADHAERCRAVWDHAVYNALEHARALLDLGAAKEHVNRVLEPFSWCWAVVTGTRFEVGHLIAQRAAGDAQPEFRELAALMREAMDASRADRLPVGCWHRPYFPPGEQDAYAGTAGRYAPRRADDFNDVSAARCARVSYTPFDADRADPGEDERLATRLWADAHLSPFEHVAMATETPAYNGKYAGFISYRKVRGY